MWGPHILPGSPPSPGAAAGPLFSGKTSPSPGQKPLARRRCAAAPCAVTLLGGGVGGGVPGLSLGVFALRRRRPLGVPFLLS